MAKEWKGNSRAAAAAINVNKQYTTSGREKDDFYATDPIALELLLDHSSLWLNGMLNDCRPFSGAHLWYNGYRGIGAPYIWECAVGSGNLYCVLEKRGYNVVYSDIKDRGFGRFKGMLKIDFLQERDFVLPCRYSVGVILTNPPYSLADEFIMHALDILPDNGLYIAFMNISYLAGKKRYENIYRYGSLREIYVFSSRVDCYKNNIPQTGNKMANYAWYVFQKGYCGQPTLYWL